MRFAFAALAVSVAMGANAVAQSASAQLGNSARTALFLGQFPTFLVEARKDFDVCRRATHDSTQCIDILVQIAKAASGRDLAALDAAVTDAMQLIDRLPALDERRMHVGFYAAQLASMQGNYPKARLELERVIQITERMRNPNYAYLAMFYRDLGNVYYEMRDYPAARAHLEKSISIFRAHAPEDRFILTYTYQSLAKTIISMNGAKEAETQLLALKGTLDIGRGDRLPLATIFGTLASASAAQGNLSQAANYAAIRLAYLQPVEQTNPMEVAHARASLASFHSQLGEERFLALAETNLAAALSVYERHVGSSHPWMLSAQNLRARILVARGRHAEAEVVLREVLTLQREIADWAHEDSIVAAWALANILHIRGTNLAETRKRYCEANIGALQRMRQHADFTPAAQAELRRYRPSFLGQISANWHLTRQQGADRPASAPCFGPG